MQPAYREHPSGLVIPTETPRTRRVAMKAEWRAYETAIDLYKRLNMRVQMACTEPGCGALRTVRGDDGSAILRCDCTDRVFQAHF